MSMKKMLFVALAVWACTPTARADVISDGSHALGGSRLYVGNLSFHQDSFFDVFFDVSLEMGGLPLAPPDPGPPPSRPSMDGVVILSESLPGGAGPPASYLASMSFFDIFTELSLDGSTAFYDTEMLSLSLEGVYPSIGAFKIRESPTLPSLGKYSVETLPSGQYHIDSFFDVFTELSLDGGQSWIPSQGSSHLTIVPEPSAIVLLVLGGLLVAILGRWRR
jgi:hypothetical protein